MVSSIMSDQLHSSVQSHLATELVLLHALIRRSKDQHRGQLFLKRLHGVYRLGRLVRAALLLSTEDTMNGDFRKDLSQLIPKVCSIVHQLC